MVGYIKTIQPAVNRLAAIHKIMGFEETQFTDDILSAAIDTINRESIHEKWSAKGFITACEQALGKKMGTSADQIHVIAAVNERFPSLNKEELLEAAQKPKPDLSTKAPIKEVPSIHRPAPSTALQLNEVNEDSTAVKFIENSTTTSLPIENNSPQLLEQIGCLVNRFADITQVDDLIHRCDAMPFGFYIEVQPDNQPNLDFDEREFRHAGWWMLASISGQLNRDWSMLLPIDSIWRRAHQNEDPDLTLEYIVQERLGMFCYLTTVAPWLIDPAHPFGSIYFSLLGALRTLREAAPERFKEVS